MKRITLFLIGLSICAFGATEEIPLESKLDQLAVPENTAPIGVAAEKIYAVQTRYSPMQYRHEISVGGATHFNSDSHLSSKQVEVDYRFYLSNRVFLGLAGSYVFNSFTDSANRLMRDVGRVPDVDYAKYKADLSVGFNVFYGKFRLSMDQVFYFDQYVSLGGGFADLASGRTAMAVGDIGMVFWFGQHMSLRFGVKDYFYKETRDLSSGNVHSLHGHVDVGVVL